ncbi:MAG: sodium:calcium antiporter [Halalkalicoccus sp.]
MRDRLSHPLAPVFLVVFLTAPWPIVRLSGVGVGLYSRVALAGISILGASFLLAWAAETAEKDVSRSFAIAVLAVLAVAPEYAVDALYAWEAGVDPGSAASAEAADLAVANMTGANRILIGIGWSAIAVFTVYRALKSRGAAKRDPNVERVEGFLADRVRLDQGLSLEIVFLFAATLYAFFIPLTGSIAIHDMVVLVGLYGLYIVFALKAPPDAEEHIGVPAYLQSFARPKRIATVLSLFAVSGLVIFVAVEPFAHGLEEIGLHLGIPPFLMIQWVAPLASETPEFVIVTLLVMKARSSASFNALISSKLNQWTLLIGTLVVVYSVSLGYYGALPMGQRQMGEIWLTAAQSYFALSLLVDLKISVREAIALFSLFIVQLYPMFHEYEWLLVFSGVYMVLGTALLIKRRAHLLALVGFVRARINGETAVRA